jgi:regulator of protease activity HflC (stomatin/prohibitin superfamily)
MGYEWIAWLGNLIKVLGDLIPQREKIPPTHRGIKFVGMQRVVVLSPGCYWYWPWRTDVHQICVAQQTLWLAEQNVTTDDGQPVKLRGTVTYRIRCDDASIKKAAVETWEIEDQIDDEAMAVYCKYVGDHTFDGLRSDRAKVNRELTELVQARLDEYGVLVVRAQLTSFTTGIPLLHMGSNTQQV